MSVNPSSSWSPTDYADQCRLRPGARRAALALLDPKPGEMILDLGCGDGVLTQKIMASGARVIGLDASPDMVEAARSRGVDAFVADAQALGLGDQAARFGQFDAAFSNAALHWMLDPDAVASGIFAVLKPGGRFAGEMGGERQYRDPARRHSRRAGRARLFAAGRRSAMVSVGRGVRPPLCLRRLHPHRRPSDPAADAPAGGRRRLGQDLPRRLARRRRGARSKRATRSPLRSRRGSRRSCASPTAAGSPIMSACASRCGSRKHEGLLATLDA